MKIAIDYVYDSETDEYIPFMTPRARKEAQATIDEQRERARQWGWIEGSPMAEVPAGALSMVAIALAIEGEIAADSYARTRSAEEGMLRTAVFVVRRPNEADQSALHESLRTPDGAVRWEPLAARAAALARLEPKLEADIPELDPGEIPLELLDPLQDELVARVFPNPSKGRRFFTRSSPPA